MGVNLARPRDPRVVQQLRKALRCTVWTCPHHLQGNQCELYNAFIVQPCTSMSAVGPRRFLCWNGRESAYR